MLEKYNQIKDIAFILAKIHVQYFVVWLMQYVCVCVAE